MDTEDTEHTEETAAAHVQSHCKTCAIVEGVFECMDPKLCKSSIYFEGVRLCRPLSWAVWNDVALPTSKPLKSA